MQRQLAESKGIVMDGRDIGTHVLPDAELKVFLMLSVQVRALQTFQGAEGERACSARAAGAGNRRARPSDERREISPLICAEDADVIDSTELTIDQVVALILDLCRTKLAEAK